MNFGKLTIAAIVFGITDSLKIDRSYATWFEPENFKPYLENAIENDWPQLLVDALELCSDPTFTSAGEECEKYGVLDAFDDQNTLYNISSGDENLWNDDQRMDQILYGMYVPDRAK